MKTRNCPSCKTTTPVEPGRNRCIHCGFEWLAIMPQEGPQETFLSLRHVDIIIYGGQAGGGKTWALLLDPVADINDPDFGAVYFRRESTQITNEGGLWDESGKLYPHLQAKSRTSPAHQWIFPSGCKFTFTHLNEEKDKYNHQGGQYPWIGFDELTHFSESQFWYLVGRNRGLCKAKKRIRAGTNPDAGSWVKLMIAPWVDEGYPEPAQAGEILWLVKLDSGYNFFKTKEEAMLFAKQEHHLSDDVLEHSVKSITFIPASVWDNKILMRDDPAYLANLLALPEVERRRLLYGDWNILTDRFFSEWQPKTAAGTPWHVIPTAKIPEGPTYYLGVDWGFSDPFVALLIAVHPDGRQTICREIYERKLKTSDQGQKMLDLLAANKLHPRDVMVHAGHDVFNRRLGSDGAYQEPIVETWFDQGLQVVSSGRDPLARASKAREMLTDWGPDEGWPNGRPGLQVMDCCKNFIRTLPLLKSDEQKPEEVDTKLEDHAYDAWGHVATSSPSRPTTVETEPERSPRAVPVSVDLPAYSDPYAQDDSQW